MRNVEYIIQFIKYANTQCYLGQFKYSMTSYVIIKIKNKNYETSIHKNWGREVIVLHSPVGF